MATIGSRPLELDLRQVDSASVLRVSGSAGMAEAEKLRVELEQLVAAKAPVIILDVSDMDFISSTGLAVIVSAEVQVKGHNGKLAMAHPTPAVRQLLETTRLTEVIPIYSSVDEAVAAS